MSAFPANLPPWSSFTVRSVPVIILQGHRVQLLQHRIDPTLGGEVYDFLLIDRPASATTLVITCAILQIRESRPLQPGTPAGSRHG